MSTNKLILTVACLASLALPVASLQAQRGPGPGGPGGPGGGFGWGPQNGLRVLGTGGCFFEERGFGNKKSTSAYSLSVVRNETRAVLSGTPTTQTDTYAVVHDANGVTYVETTRNSKTLVCINDPANRVHYLVTLTAPNTGTALEFQQPGKGPRFGDALPPKRDGNDKGPNPPPNGKSNPDVTRYPNITLAQVLADIPTAEQPPSPLVPASAWGACTAFDLTLVAHGQSQGVRVFCSTLGVNLYTLMSDPYVKSTVTATIVAPPGAVTPPITYPLPNTVTVTVVKGGPGAWNPRGPRPPQP